MSWEMETAGTIEEDRKSLHKYTIIETIVLRPQMQSRRSLAASTPWQWYIPTPRDCFSDEWLGQVLAIVFSLCCSVAIITILSVYNKRPVPALLGSITLNAIISVLATASKGALLFTIASCLGQLKWSWLRTDNFRVLDDFDLFDSASRGPLGAINFICRMREGPTILLGAFLTLAALGFDPFVQQVLTFESGILYHPSINVTVPQVEMYLLQADSESAASAIYAGIWGSDFTIEAACGSGNCTFEPFESIGWCSKCYEDTSWRFRGDCSLVFDPYQFTSLQSSGGNVFNPVVDRTCTLTSESGRELEVLITAESITSEESPGEITTIIISVPYQHTRLVYDVWSDSTFANISLETAPLGRWAFIHFKVSDWLLQVDNAMTCDLDFCLRNDSVTVTAATPTVDVLSTSNGRRYTHNFTLPTEDHEILELICWDPKETPIDSFQVEVRSSDSHNRTAIAYSSATFAWCLDSSGGEQWAWAYAIDNVLDSKLARLVVVHPIVDVSGSPADPVTHSGTFMPSELDSESWYINDYDANDVLAGQSLLISRRIGADTLMQNIALSLTRLGEVYGNITMIEGKLGSTVTMVVVRWAWLVLPAAVVIGTTLLLALTMFTTHRTRTPVWKSSANALLYHGLNYDVEDLEELGTISEMNKKARLTQVRLVKSDKTGRLYLKTQ